MKPAKPKRKTVVPTISLGQKNILAKATWLYYHQKLTQQQVATELGLSRPTVVRLLRQALEEGIVTFSLRLDMLKEMELSTHLAGRFGLKEVFIVPTSIEHTQADVLRAVGEMGALYLEENLRPNQVMALTWGKTLLRVATSLHNHPVKGVVIAQTLGGLNTGHNINPYRVASIFGEKLHAPVYHLYAPMMLASKELRDLLLSDSGIQATLAVARLAAMTLVSVGKVDTDATVVQTGLLNVSIIDQLKARGAVGDISGHYFDLQGKRVSGDIDDHMVALPWEDFQRLENVVAIVCGTDKRDAILGALRTGVLKRLIIDDQTALDLVEADGGGAPEPVGLSGLHEN